MKIAQICQRFYYGGGQERHVLHISKNLVKMGHKVTIITSDIGISEEFKKHLDQDGVKIKKIPAIELDEPENQVLFPSLLSYLMKKDFDIIHAHGSLCQSSQQALIAAKYLKKPFVFTPHYHPWNVFSNPKTRRIRRYVERMITAPVASNASAVIAVSDYEKQLLNDKYPEINENKIKVITNGVDIKFIEETSSRKNVRKKFNIPNGKKYVLFFGSISDLRKGIDRALNAFAIVAKKIPDAHLIILGKNTDKSIAIRNLIKKLRITGRVTPCGYVSDRDKVAFLRMSDVLISPTVYEAFGIVLAEAMYSGVPVVATKSGGIPYVFEHNVHGYLVGDYNSIHAFAKYTIRLLKDEKLRSRLGKAGHKRVKEKFQWPIISRKIEKLYLSLINKKNSPENNFFEWSKL